MCVCVCGGGYSIELSNCSTTCVAMLVLLLSCHKHGILLLGICEQCRPRTDAASDQGPHCLLKNDLLKFV